MGDVVFNIEGISEPVESEISTLNNLQYFAFLKETQGIVIQLIFYLSYILNDGDFELNIQLASSYISSLAEDPSDPSELEVVFKKRPKN